MRNAPKFKWVLLFAIGAVTLFVAITPVSYLVAVFGARAIGALGRVLGVQPSALWTWTGMRSLIFLTALPAALFGWLLWRIAYLVVEIRKLRKARQPHEWLADHGRYDTPGQVKGEAWRP
jgi:hypothetical protein